MDPSLKRLDEPPTSAAPLAPSFDSLDLGPDPGDETLSARLDRALVALDRFRDRPAVSVAMVAAAVGLLALAWWLGRPPEAADDLGIPYTPALTVEAATAATTVGAASAAGPTGLAPTAGDGRPLSGSPPSTTTPATAPDLVVHVAGAVARPGIVRVSPGSRVADVVAAAGGALDEADLERLNLAAPVADGMQVRVPLVGEPATSPTGMAAPPSAPAPGTGGATPTGASGAGLVDLNQADAATLETLHGIGPALAEAIIEWRRDRGPFATVEQLLEVPGIGPATLDGLADDVTVG